MAVFYEAKSGYVGAYANCVGCAFNSELLQTIARELAELMPTVFRGHKLVQMWSYAYDDQEKAHTGIGLHADPAAVNVNLWYMPLLVSNLSCGWQGATRRV